MTDYPGDSISESDNSVKIMSSFLNMRYNAKTYMMQGDHNSCDMAVNYKQVTVNQYLAEHILYYVMHIRYLKRF